MARNNRKGKGAGITANKRWKKHLLFLESYNRKVDYLRKRDSKVKA